jgi:hypothetical protein
MPPRFTLGDTLSFTKTLADYPAGVWTLYYRLMLRAGLATPISFNSTAIGTDHAISVSAVTTATWVPTTYTWASWVSDGTNVFSIDQGSTALLANPRTAGGDLDLRTPAQVALDNVRATIQGKATADVLRYTIGGRQLERYPMAELIALEQRLAQQVARESRSAALAAGLADPRRYSVRLGRA